MRGILEIREIRVIRVIREIWDIWFIWDINIQVYPVILSETNLFVFLQ